MQTIQLEIKNDNLAKKILSILDVFKDDGVFIKNVTKNDEIPDKTSKKLIDVQIESMSKTWDNKKDEAWDEFNNDIKQAFYELKNNQGKRTGKFIEIEK